MHTPLLTQSRSSLILGNLTPQQRSAAADLLHELLDTSIDFKLRRPIVSQRLSPQQLRDRLVVNLPHESRDAAVVAAEIVDELLPLCKNEASPQFCGFGDTGADVAALAGGLVDMFAQQNLINQSFDSPAATFTEITVLRWLRDLIGYTNPPVAELTSVWDVGGLVTTGGTMSNTIAMMLARERRAPDTMLTGVRDPQRFGIVVPAGIGHYSVKAAGTWIGVGAHIIEVPTQGYRYDLSALADTLRHHRGQVMSVVAYAGDSRTQTIDHLADIAATVNDFDDEIWLHADACWGLVAAFSPTTAHLLEGIDQFDSVTVDPHKVMSIPYSQSALLVKQPQVLRTVSSYSDLIMQEDWAFGQVTPLLGTKGWGSLKLWAMMKSHGRAGLAAITEQRLAAAAKFASLVDASPQLRRLHDPDLAAVVFCYLPDGTGPGDVERINAVNKAIHTRMLNEGEWHLHTFTLPDDHGHIEPGALLQPLRFMANNPRTTTRDLQDLIAYIHDLAASVGAE